MRPRPRRQPGGFTLIELGIVVAILAILAAAILVAAMDGVRRAEERATQSLIIKLDNALNDRIEALLNATADVSPAHADLAAIPNPSGGLIQSLSRAQVIARIEQLKTELPDVFFVQVDPTSLSATSGDIYPINFAGQPYLLTATAQTAYFSPMGTLPELLGGATPAESVRGIYGASWEAMAGIHKNLGYLPTGYDGRDNDGDGYVDEWGEGVNASNVDLVKSRLLNHMRSHKTARSEMLYSLLVEGQSSLGSVLSRDDFTSREVQDTDDDGLPEFVDAWGEPIQFFRWPTHYVSDIQKGVAPYNGVFEQRQVSALDPNQQLVSVAWFSDLGAPANMSARAIGFQRYFQSLMDPVGGTNGWDRSGAYPLRRSYFTKHLIISGGPDQKVGLGLLDADSDDDGAVDLSLYVAGSPGSAPSVPTALSGGTVADKLILIENEAAAYSPVRVAAPGNLYQVPGTTTAAQAQTFAIRDAAGDDITNHNVQGAGGGLR